MVSEYIHERASTLSFSCLPIFIMPSIMFIATLIVINATGQPRVALSLEVYDNAQRT
jgi:hypothetical protein